jgi:hypothetical protein
VSKADPASFASADEGFKEAPGDLVAHPDTVIVYADGTRDLQLCSVSCYSMTLMAGWDEERRAARQAFRSRL